MAGQLLVRCRSSSNFLSNLSTFYRAFSAASPRKVNLPTDSSSELDEAKRSEHWKEFKSWISNHKKCCRTHKQILYRFTIFAEREEFKNKLAKAKCSEEWKVFEPWISKYKKRYMNERQMLYRFSIFIESMKRVEEMNKVEDGGGSYDLNYFSDMTADDDIAIRILSYTFLSELSEGLISKDQEWKKFLSWKSKYKKRYESNEERLHRYRIFKECVQNIKKAKKENPTCTFDFNQFSDLTSEELPPGESSFTQFCPRKLRMKLKKKDY